MLFCGCCFSNYAIIFLMILTEFLFTIMKGFHASNHSQVLGAGGDRKGEVEEAGRILLGVMYEEEAAKLVVTVHRLVWLLWCSRCDCCGVVLVW